MGSVLEKILNSGGVGGAIRELANVIVSFAGGFNIPETTVLIAGLVIAALVGILGYKYIKLFSTILFGVVGYIVGAELFRLARENLGWKLPDFCVYIFGVVLLFLLGFVAYKKIAYALFLIAALFGFMLSYFIYPNYLVAVAIAIVVAMLAISFVRYGYTVIFSSGAGFCFIGTLSLMCPDVKVLSLSEGFIGILLAIVVSCIFLAIQLRLSQGEYRSKFAPRRVKIRRVFDTW